MIRSMEYRIAFIAVDVSAGLVLQERDRQVNRHTVDTDRIVQLLFFSRLRKANTTDCNNPECTTVQCRFRVRDECVLSDGRRLTWFGARSVCRSLGGDLWTLGTLDDMYQVSQYLLRSTPYWLGATDHVWAFAPGKDKGERIGLRLPDAGPFFSQPPYGH